MKKISPFNWFLLGVIVVACIAAAATTLKSVVIQNDLVVQGNLYCSNSIYTPLFGVGTLVLTNKPAFNNTATTNDLGQTINQQLNTNVNWSQQFGYGPLTNWGASGYVTAGTRTLFHDANQTVIQNTGTLTSNVWSGGSEKLYYNGTATIDHNKTNGIITANGYATSTNGFSGTIDFTQHSPTTNLNTWSLTIPVGIANVPTTNSDAVVLTLKSGMGATNFSFTTDNTTWFTSDHSATHWVTNGHVAQLMVQVIPGLATNAYFIQCDH